MISALKLLSRHKPRKIHPKLEVVHGCGNHLFSSLHNLDWSNPANAMH
jgi:hypothetical protein